MKHCEFFYILPQDLLCFVRAMKSTPGPTPHCLRYRDWSSYPRACGVPMRQGMSSRDPGYVLHASKARQVSTACEEFNLMLHWRKVQRRDTRVQSPAANQNTEARQEAQHDEQRVRDDVWGGNNSPVPLVGDVRITIFLSQTRERVSERESERELLGAGGGRYYVASDSWAYCLVIFLRCVYSWGMSASLRPYFEKKKNLRKLKKKKNSCKRWWAGAAEHNDRTVRCSEQCTNEWWCSRFCTGVLIVFEPRGFL